MVVWPRREERENGGDGGGDGDREDHGGGAKVRVGVEAKAKVNKMWTRMVWVLFSFERSEKMNEGRENIEGACRCKRRRE